MHGLKNLLAAVAIFGAGICGSTNFAEAQDYVFTAPPCVAAGPWRWYYGYHPNYFVADWSPFFRHHYYRYGPILNCLAIEGPPVLSSRY
jgi:hypothetical protein